MFRSRDGGETWQKVLFASADAGAIDLAMDPTNPRDPLRDVLVESLRRRGRSRAAVRASDLEIDRRRRHVDRADATTKGLPTGFDGISGITVSAGRNPDNVYAIVEAEDGGVFRSDNGGDSWRRVNDDRDLRQRAWYYTRIYADPIDADVVYVLNVSFHRSKDGGKTFTRRSARRTATTTTCGSTRTTRCA